MILQILCVTADNTSNILQAFNLPKEKAPQGIDIWEEGNDCDESEDEWEEVEEPDELIDSEDLEDVLFDCLQLEAQDQDRHQLLLNPTPTSSTFPPQNEISDLHPLSRNPCLAHLLQLAINDALNGNRAITHCTKKIGSIVNFFHKSNKYYCEFKDFVKGRSLLKPVCTRWNSLYFCLERIFNTDNPEVFFVNESFRF